MLKLVIFRYEVWDQTILASPGAKLQNLRLASPSAPYQKRESIRWFEVKQDVVAKWLPSIPESAPPVSPPPPANPPYVYPHPDSTACPIPAMARPAPERLAKESLEGGGMG